MEEEPSVIELNHKLDNAKKYKIDLENFCLQHYKMAKDRELKEIYASFSETKERTNKIEISLLLLIQSISNSNKPDNKNTNENKSTISFSLYLTLSYLLFLYLYLM